ncbi:MAG: hypothetical protein WCG47_09435, partial [Dermatophilaceae bacterium]
MAWSLLKLGLLTSPRRRDHRQGQDHDQHDRQAHPVLEGSQPSRRPRDRRGWPARGCVNIAASTVRLHLAVRGVAV